MDCASYVHNVLMMFIKGTFVEMQIEVLLGGPARVGISAKDIQ